MIARIIDFSARNKFVIFLFVAFLIAVGATSFELTGYGGRKELVIALAILGSSIVLFAFRRIVQDGTRLTLRERTPETPETVPGTPALDTD